MDYTFWSKQTAGKPLFEDIVWNKPEQRSRAGKLGIIGGNKLGFASIAEAYALALSTGAGQVKILLPDALKKSLPSSMIDATFAPTNQSGSLSKDATTEMKAMGEWADGILLIGDAGRNSETAIAYEDFINNYKGPLTITRDSIDLIKNASASVVERPDTLLVVSFAQLQKLFQAVYYPKVLTFSMQLTNLAEALHKFTITYPCSITVFHKDHILIASGGRVASQEWDNPMAIWRGSVATNASVYWLWNTSKTFESITTSII
jgi:NAD(P)H-hydrate repair Nnr-like enzyme with NAD(P)H-hydrate dehydratase domain